MRHVFAAILVMAAAALLLLAQRGSTSRAMVPLNASLEYRALTPREFAPAQYNQVDEREIARMTEEGWQLVAVSPWVLKNEERGPREGNRPVTTQVYPAYYFTRRLPER